MILDPVHYVKNSCVICSTKYEQIVRICRACKNPTSMSFQTELFKNDMVALTEGLALRKIKQQEVLKIFDHEDLQGYLADGIHRRLSAMLITEFELICDGLKALIDKNLDPSSINLAIRITNKLLKRLKIMNSHLSKPFKNPLKVLLYRYTKHVHDFTQYKTLCDEKPKIFADLKLKVSHQKKQLDEQKRELSKMQAAMLKVPDYMDLYHRFIHNMEYMEENEINGEMMRMKLEYEVAISILRTINDFSLPTEEVLEASV